MSNRSVEAVLQSLNSVHSGETEKTAQDSTGDTDNPGTDADEKVAQKRADLESSLQQMLGSNTKQASDNQPTEQGADAVAHLEKIANDMAQSDLQATIKEAHAFGAAVFDGFLARANSYTQNTKTASAPQPQYQGRDTIKEAAAAGYQATGQFLDAYAGSQQEKIAHGTEEQGIVDALEKLAADSEDCFLRGHQHMNDLSQRLG